MYKHMRAVFRAHRRALKNNVEYCARKRDPLSVNADESGGESSIDTTPLSTGLPVYLSTHKVGTVQKIDLGCS